MSKKKEHTTPSPAPKDEQAGQQPQEPLPETQSSGSQQPPEEQPPAPEPEAQSEQPPVDDRFLRLAAEYDNYRKRTAKEKESLWANAKADTAAAFLPVYDNLERALKQPCADEAYKKGVEMTMSQLKEVFAKLGLTEIPALGQPFDPQLHNAVMHVEDENFGENTVSEVFQAGFQLGGKVIRFSMVKVAN